MKDWRVAQKMIVFLFIWKEKIKQIIYIWHCINYEKQKTRTILKEKNRKRANTSWNFIKLILDYRRRLESTLKISHLFNKTLWIDDHSEEYEKYKQETTIGSSLTLKRPLLANEAANSPAKPNTTIASQQKL